MRISMENISSKLSVYLDKDSFPRFHYWLVEDSQKTQEGPIASFPFDWMVTIRERVMKRGWWNFLDHFKALDCFLEKGFHFGSIDPLYSLYLKVFLYFQETLHVDMRIAKELGFSFSPDDQRCHEKDKMSFNIYAENMVKLPPIQVIIPYVYPNCLPLYEFGELFDIYLPGLKVKFDKAIRQLGSCYSVSIMLSLWKSHLQQYILEKV